MGKIAEFSNPINGVQTSEQGVNALKEQGNALRQDAGIEGRAFGGVLANAGQAWDEREKAQTADYTSKATLAFSNAEVAASDDWNELSANADPNTADADGKAFLEKQAKVWDDIVATAPNDKARAWAQTKANEAHLSLQKTVRADTSTLTGIAAAGNTEDHINNLATQARNNPEQAETLIGRVDKELNDLIPPGMAPAARAKLIATEGRAAKAFIAQQALEGMIASDPEATQKMLEKGDLDPYIKLMSPDDQNTTRNQVASAIAAQRTADRLEKERKATAETKAQKTAVDQAVGKLYSDQVDPATGKVTIKPNFSQRLLDIAKMPGATPEDITNMQAYAARADKPGVTVNGPMWGDLLNRALLPPGDPNRLTEKEIIASAGRGDIIIGEKGDLLLMKALKATEGKDSAIATVSRDQAYKRFDAPTFNNTGRIPTQQDTDLENYSHNWFITKYDAAHKAGIKDDELFDPNNKNYIWNGFDPSHVPKNLGIGGGLVTPPGVQHPSSAAVPTGSGSAVPPNKLPLNPDGTIPLNNPALNGLLGKVSYTAPAGGFGRVNVPVAYHGVIAETAQESGVPAAILAAQIQQESGFRNLGANSKGAAGVSQFIPETAKRFGVDVRDPVSSIKGQGKYMAWLMKRYGGNLTYALAGYNWGEGNVDKWIAAGAQWNRLPAETQGYVKNILSMSGAQTSV